MDNMYKRTFYFLCFIFLVFSQFWWGKKPTSFKDWALFLIICLPFLYQAVFNNRTGWVVLIVLAILHLLLTIMNIFESGNQEQLPIISILYLIAGIVLYLLRPPNQHI